MKDGFFKQNARFVQSVLLLSDLLVVLLAFLLAHRWKFGGLDVSPANFLVIVVSMLLLHLVFSMSGIYRGWRGRSVISELSTVLVGLFIVLLLLSLLAFVSKTGGEFSRIWITQSFGLTIVGMLLSRSVIRSFAKWTRSKGRNHRTLLLVGAGDLGSRVVKSLEAQPGAGFKVVGFLDDSSALKDRSVEGVGVLGRCSEAADIVEKFRQEDSVVDHVWITLPVRALYRAEQLIDSLQDSATSVSVVPDFFDIQQLVVSIDNVADIPLINLSIKPLIGLNSLLKSSIDLILALLFLILTVPLFVIIAIIIKLDSPGSVFFSQRRYGIDGREIMVCKFRTMSVQENGSGVVQAKKGDVRVTRVGRILRKTSLDEIPQFFNVLRGSMSIVGPRPHAVSHNELYRKRIKGYMIRHTIKPGITGLAQVSGCRGETETDAKMQMRVNYDLSYIKTWSLMLDLNIMLKTAWQLLFPRNVY